MKKLRTRKYPEMCGRGQSCVPEGSDFLCFDFVRIKYNSQNPGVNKKASVADLSPSRIQNDTKHRGGCSVPMLSFCLCSILVAS